MAENMEPAVPVKSKREMLSDRLKKKYPDIAAECSKSSAKAGYVKITLKGDKS